MVTGNGSLLPICSLQQFLKAKFDCIITQELKLWKIKIQSEIISTHCAAPQSIFSFFLKLNFSILGRNYSSFMRGFSQARQYRSVRKFGDSGNLSLCGILYPYSIWGCRLFLQTKLVPTNVFDIPLPLQCMHLPRPQNLF